MGESKFVELDWEQIQTALLTDTVCNINDVRLHMNIDPVEDVQQIDFQVHRLIDLSEHNYQSTILSPLSEAHSFILDTHSSNKVGKHLCVSLVSDGNIKFNAKPDAIHAYIPMVVEVKSRVTPTSSSKLETGETIGLSNITNVEIDLFQQCLERVIGQIQFRAYLSKFIVLASTGHMSWCFYFTCDYVRNPYKQLRIFRVTSVDINNIWNEVCKAVEVVGNSYYLIPEAPIIFQTIQWLNNEVDLHSVRVHVAGISSSPVFYITLPINGNVIVQAKSWAFKIVIAKDAFTREVLFLKAIKEQWNLENDFYYLNDTDTLLNEIANTGHNLRMKKKARYDWLDFSKLAMTGGIIVMRPGDRDKLRCTIDANGSIFSQLLASLKIAHKASILHCDISPSNCMKFGDDWQLIDYGLAVPMLDNGYGEVTIEENTYQRVCCGYRVQVLLKDVDKIRWTIEDDVEMLHCACLSVHRNI